MNASSSQWQSHFINTNNIKLHCVTQGEGDLAILLHGFPEFWYAWRYQIPVLARHFKVVVPDLRGYNDSDKPAGGYDLDTLSADVRGLIASLGYSKAHIVGHDWGGAIAWHLAQKFPHIVNRLAVLNAPHPQRFIQEIGGNLEQLRRSWYFLAFQLPVLPEWLIQQNLKEFIHNFLHAQAVRKGAFSQADAQKYQTALAKPGAIAAAINYYRSAFSPQTWWQQWGRSPQLVTAPTLILWSEEDAFLCKKLTEGMEQLIAAPFQLKFVPQCGHWMQQEVPQTVNRELINFLRAPSLTASSQPAIKGK